jgi:hypothetical protein
LFLLHHLPYHLHFRVPLPLEFLLLDLQHLLSQTLIQTSPRLQPSSCRLSSLLQVYLLCRCPLPLAFPQSNFLVRTSRHLLAHVQPQPQHVWGQLLNGRGEFVMAMMTAVMYLVNAQDIWTTPHFRMILGRPRLFRSGSHDAFQCWTVMSGARIGSSWS